MRTRSRAVAPGEACQANLASGLQGAEHPSVKRKTPPFRAGICSSAICGLTASSKTVRTARAGRAFTARSGSCLRLTGLTAPFVVGLRLTPGLTAVVGLWVSRIGVPVALLIGLDVSHHQFSLVVKGEGAAIAFVPTAALHENVYSMRLHSRNLNGGP